MSNHGAWRRATDDPPLWWVVCPQRGSPGRRADRGLIRSPVPRSKTQHQPKGITEDEMRVFRTPCAGRSCRSDRLRSEPGLLWEADLHSPRQLCLLSGDLPVLLSTFGHQACPLQYVGRLPAAQRPGPTDRGGHLSVLHRARPSRLPGLGPPAHRPLTALLNTVLCRPAAPRRATPAGVFLAPDSPSPFASDPPVRRALFGRRRYNDAAGGTRAPAGSGPPRRTAGSGCRIQGSVHEDTEGSALSLRRSACERGHRHRSPER